MITSPQNEKLKLIRKLRTRRGREREGLFVAEGEDLIEMAAALAWEPVAVLRAGEDVEPALLAAVSDLGSGTRVLGVYRQRWVEPGGADHRPDIPRVAHAVQIHRQRAAHALADGPVAVGPGCADPFSPKAVRASMGSIFARPPARADAGALGGRRLALDPRAELSVGEVDPAPPLVVLAGAERRGLPADLLDGADARARIPIRDGGPDSLNVAMAVTVALYEVGRRMAGHA